MLNNEIFISFCISTFNRSEKIAHLVSEILKYNGNDIEVIVSDNFSTDNTTSELAKIRDPRFNYIVNGSNVGAVNNYLKVMSHGNGKYVFFSTDKDHIDSSGIAEFIEFLRSAPTVIAGYCELNVSSKYSIEILDNGFKSLDKIGYLSRHPTGYFYLNNLLKDLNITVNYSNPNKVGSFPFEFILAEFCMRGSTAIIRTPLCYIESLEDVKSIKSYTYSGDQNNLYFSPQEKYKMAERYIDQLKMFDLPQSEKIAVVKKIFRSGISSATVGYKSMLQNEIICNHYNITSRRISVLEILTIDYLFSHKFIIGCNFSNIFTRTLMCLEIHLVYIKTFVPRIVKNILHIKSNFSKRS